VPPPPGHSLFEISLVSCPPLRDRVSSPNSPRSSLHYASFPLREDPVLPARVSHRSFLLLSRLILLDSLSSEEAIKQVGILNFFLLVHFYVNFFPRPALSPWLDAVDITFPPKLTFSISIFLHLALYGVLQNFFFVDNIFLPPVVLALSLRPVTPLPASVFFPLIGSSMGRILRQTPFPLRSFQELPFSPVRFNEFCYLPPSGPPCVSDSSFTRQKSLTLSD